MSAIASQLSAPHARLPARGAGARLFAAGAGAALLPVRSGSRPAQRGYRFSSNPDGTYNVHDVPIFSAHVDTRRKPPLAITETWLRNALGRAHAREAEGELQGQVGYLPPLHVYHHTHQNGEARETIPAGHYRPTRVGDLLYEGELVPTLFADYVRVPRAVFAGMVRGAFPYRSVEVHPPHFKEENAEVDSLALLPDEVPFFRLPLLRIASEGPAPAAYRAARPGSPVLATISGAACYAALMNYAGGPQMADSALKDAPKTTGKTDDAPPGSKGELQKAADAHGGAKMSAADAHEAPPAHGAPPAHAAEAPPAWAGQILALLQQIAANMAPAAPADPLAFLDGDPQRLKEKGGIPPVPPVASASAASGETEEIRAYRAVAEGRIGELERRIKERDDREALETAIGKAEKELEGLALGASWRADLRDAGKQGGPGAVERFASTIRKHAARLPGSSSPTMGDGAGQSPSDPPMVAAYAALGAEHGETARSLLKQRAMLPEKQRIASMGDAEYLRWQPALRGLKPVIPS